MGGGRYRRPLFAFSVNNSVSMKKKTRKVHNSYPSYFPILHVSTNFHHDQINNKGKNC